LRAFLGERGDGSLQAHPDEVWIRYSFDPSESWKRVALPWRRSANVVPLTDDRFLLHPNPVPMPRQKTIDLHKHNAWLPAEFHHLYPASRANDLSDNDTDESD
jgi:hypothetical protein